MIKTYKGGLMMGRQCRKGMTITKWIKMDRGGGSVMDFCEYVNQTSDTMKAAIPLTG
jgi:hypothetical protein